MNGLYDFQGAFREILQPRTYSGGNDLVKQIGKEEEEKASSHDGNGDVLYVLDRVRSSLSHPLHPRVCRTV